ncbi:MAG: hypothetical protein WDA02_06770 [Saccharofermentanales bacterium]
MKKYIEYITENEDNESNVGLDETINDVLSKFISNIEKLKKETMQKLNNGSSEDTQEKSQNKKSSIDDNINILLNNLEQIKNDGKLDELIKQCVNSINLINKENGRLLKVEPQDDDIKSSIEKNKKNRELLDNLLIKARELKK